MYGVNATVAEAAIDEATTARFGYEPQHLMVYRAAYALITSNCFSPSGSDGYFEWCIRVLPAAASSLKLSNSDINRHRRRDSVAHRLERVHRDHESASARPP